jgi:hypothetical protein
MSDIFFMISHEIHIDIGVEMDGCPVWALKLTQDATAMCLCRLQRAFWGLTPDFVAEILVLTP